MNRTDRLLALVLELRESRWTRGEALAAHFGVSVRTIYRDMLALTEAGVPVLSVPGQGYRLMEGYFLPPLHLTQQEAVMLAFGLDAVVGTFDAEYAQAAESATRKVMAALPEQRRQEVESLRSQIRLIEPERADTAEPLRLLRTALLAHRSVSFRYHSPQGASERGADPHGLIRANGVWMLAAHDHGRGDRRTFRLDRMEAVRLGEVRATARTALGAAPPGERRDLRVRLRFPAEAERWVNERRSFYEIGGRQTASGYEVTLTVRRLTDVLPWVLSWGALVAVLEPPELAEQVRQEARAVLERS